LVDTRVKPRRIGEHLTFQKGQSERKDEDGSVHVLLDTDRTQPVSDQSTDQPRPDERSELVEELRDRVSYLERALEEERETRTDERRRHHTLMAPLMQRIPQIDRSPLRTARSS
jgi:hypothetical protein